MIQNLLVACGLALSVGVSSLNNDHNTDRMTTQSTTIYDGGVTTVTIQYQYETNEVNSIDDLVEGNIYKFTYLGNSNVGVSYFSSSYIYGFISSDNIFTISYSELFSIQSHSQYYGTNHLYLYITFGTGYNTTNVLFLDNVFYAIYNGNLNNDLFTYFNVSESDYLGSYVSEVTNVMPTSLLEIFDNFINERIFNHSKLATLKTTIFGQEMSVASWLSLSVSIVLGILFLVVLIKGAIWVFKIVGNIALLR